MKRRLATLLAVGLMSLPVTCSTREQPKPATCECDIEDFLEDLIGDFEQELLDVLGQSE